MNGLVILNYSKKHMEKEVVQPKEKILCLSFVRVCVCMCVLFLYLARIG